MPPESCDQGLGALAGEGDAKEMLGSNKRRRRGGVAHRSHLLANGSQLLTGAFAGWSAQLQKREISPPT